MDNDYDKTMKLVALEEIRRRITGCYHLYSSTGKQSLKYPPFKIASFEDRPQYQIFILNIIDEYKKELEQ